MGPSTLGCLPRGTRVTNTPDVLTNDLAATWAVDDGAKSVMVFTDSTYQIAIDKADRMKKTVRMRGLRCRNIWTHLLLKPRPLCGQSQDGFSK